MHSHQLVNGYSFDVDACVLLKYEIGSKKEDHEFFVVPETNTNITLGRDLVKQIGVCMYYDLGCI